MPRQTITRTFTQDHEGDNAVINVAEQHRRGSVSFGRYSHYVQSITLPESIRIGDEYVSIRKPLLVLNRNFSVLTEFFQKPYFHIARKIRIRFHWEGIHVLGANMEEPNCFLLPIPFYRSEPHNWFLKLSCLPECTPGMKSLYVSVEILRENLVARLAASVAKVFAFLSLLLTLALPVLYFLSDAVRIYINDEFGISANGTISLAAVIIFSIFIRPLA